MAGEDYVKCGNHLYVIKQLFFKHRQLSRTVAMSFTLPEEGIYSLVVRSFGATSLGADSAESAINNN